MVPDASSVAEAVKLMESAKRPVLFVGQGARGGRDEILALSERFSMPVVLSVLGKGIIPDSAENFMGMAARVATKPANEALQHADLIVFMGSNFPFARFFFPSKARFIQVDTDSAALGRRHATDVAILGDARETMRQMTLAGKQKPVLLEPVDFAKAAESMGARGFTVTRRDQLRAVFDQAKNSDVPVVIDVKIANTRPFPAEAMILGPDKFSSEAIAAFRTRYSALGMTLLKDLL